MTNDSNGTVYCPYTDREIPEEESSSEHIIPLALGGVDGFEIPVDRDINSIVGSELEGSLANEFIWALRRTKYDARGHSGKEPFARIKKASYGEEGRPAQAQFHHRKGVRVWDVRDREYKRGKGSISISTSLKIDLPVRFTAKVALAAGYFVYGDLFRQHVDHRQLRDVMNLDPAKLDLNEHPDDLGVGHLTLRVDNYLREAPSDPDSTILCLRMFCSSIRGTVVVLMPGQDCFGVGVGLLGHYLAMVNVPARCEMFPNEGAYAWGHVLAIADKKLTRCSLVEALRKWAGIPEQCEQ